MNSAGVEVADIFRQYGPAYREAHDLPLQMLKVMSAIEKCRTSDLGGIKYECDNTECGHITICYKPCGNRHCPKCDFLKKEKWLLARKRDLLPISYFHVVFTIPEKLNPIVLVNQKIMYDILFRAGSETLLELGKDPKHLGGQIGFIAVLHTWGQNLMDHPHLHCLVPGGGLSQDANHWLKPKKQCKDKAFFIHVNILSDLFKKKFLAYLKEAYHHGDLKLIGKIDNLNNSGEFRLLVNELYQVKWVSYCESPFRGAKKVLEYLGRYTYRVAISNHRIVKLENDQVTFRWRDYRDNQEKLMTISAFEFIRRFLMHVLPKGFFKIRYYGLFGSRNLKTKLKRCKQLLSCISKELESDWRADTWQELFLELTGMDVRVCPKCKTGRMMIKEVVPTCHSSPPKLN